MTTQHSSIQLGSWQAAGAWQGGTVVGVAAARHAHGHVRLLAATRAGLYCSDDAGASWAAAWVGIADPNIMAVTAAGRAGAGWPIVFAATETGRLYRSEDGGESWTEVVAWAGLGVASVLCASPGFVDDASLFVGTAEGVLRTLDGGASWESSTFGLVDVDVLCIACAPDFAASQLLWTGTAGGGLYRSRNQARAWRESGIGLPDAPVQVLAVSPAFAEDRTLYAGLEGHGVYRSTDAGENWTAWGEALAGHSVNALICLDDGLGLIAATDRGLFASDGAGDAWQEAANSHPAVLALDVAGKLAVAGTYVDGLMVSQDRGRTWQQAVSPPVHVPPLVVARGEQWAALDVDGALAFSHDGGAAWQPIAPPEVNALYALAAQGVDAKLPLLAATGDGLWALDAASGEWNPHHSPGLPTEAILGVVAAEDGGAHLAYTASGGLFARSGAQEAWQEISGPWRDQTILRALPAQDESGELRAAALTIQPDEQGHYAIHLWLYERDEWLRLADLAADIPAMQAAWPQIDLLWLATQHRIVRLQRKAHDGMWEVDQHFFTPGEQITALHVVRGQDDVWLATTQAVYHSPGPDTAWTRAADLPDRQPLVFLRAQASGLEAMSLGGSVWRASCSGA